MYIYLIRLRYDINGMPVINPGSLLRDQGLAIFATYVLTSAVCLPLKLCLPRLHGLSPLLVVDIRDMTRHNYCRLQVKVIELLHYDNFSCPFLQ